MLVYRDSCFYYINADIFGIYKIIVKKKQTEILKILPVFKYDMVLC